MIEFKCQRECECFVKKREMKSHNCMTTIKNKLNDTNHELDEFRKKELDRVQKKEKDEIRRTERRYRYE